MRKPPYAVPELECQTNDLQSTTFSNTRHSSDAPANPDERDPAPEQLVLDPTDELIDELARPVAQIVVAHRVAWVGHWVAGGEHVARCAQ